VYEGSEGFGCFPTFALVLPFLGLRGHDVQSFPPEGMVMLPPALVDAMGGAQVLHGEQQVEWHGALPVRGGRFRTDATVEGVRRRGKGCLVTVRSVITDADTGIPIASLTSGTFVVGLEPEVLAALPAGGGDHGEGETVVLAAAPEGCAPTATVRCAVGPTQALLYRLSGDYNALHADPSIAAMLGLGEKPILHGLCTLGMAARALVRLGTAAGGCGGDPARLRAVACRFVAPVFPGDELETAVWAEGRFGSSGVRVVRFQVRSRGAVVVDRGTATIACNALHQQRTSRL